MSSVAQTFGLTGRTRCCHAKRGVISAPTPGSDGARVGGWGVPSDPGAGGAKAGGPQYPVISRYPRPAWLPVKRTGPSQ